MLVPDPCHSSVVEGFQTLQVYCAAPKGAAFCLRRKRLGRRIRRRQELECRPAAFADIVSVPGWDFDLNVALNHRLTAEARTQCQTSGHVEAVQFVIFGFRQVLFPFEDDHVTGGTRAAPAASMLQVNIGI